MIPKFNINVFTERFSFFAVNCKKIGDPISYANLAEIRTRSYDLGIILNGSTIDPMFENFDIPLYSATSDSDRYFVLDVVHQNSQKRTYRFIFADIENIYGKSGTKEDNSNSTDNKVNVEFLEWFDSVLECSQYIDHLFVVTNITPFHYIKNNSTNDTRINNFIDLVENSTKHHLTWLSTDNDYYNNVTVYGSKNNFSLVTMGSLAKVTEAPEILSRQGYCSLPNYFFISNDTSSNRSGFAEIIIDDETLRIKYLSLSNIGICKYTINNAIRIIEKSNYRLITKQELFYLCSCRKIIAESNILEIYLQSVIKKNKLKRNLLLQHMLHNFIDDLNNVIHGG